MRLILVSKFLFKQFEVAHDKCAFKVGTDSILLGSWVTGEFESVLDIGCGSGLLALMCAQKFEVARIIGVEIDADSAAQAQKNVFNSPWSDRVEVSCDDIRRGKKEPFDLIISNPPYFPSQLESPSLRKNVARQERSLSLFDLMVSAQSCSHSESILALVFPFDRLEELKKVGAGQGWYLRREMRLVSMPGKRCERVLTQFERSDGDLDSKILRIEDEMGRYSHEFKEMTSMFYLKF